MVNHFFQTVLVELPQLHWQLHPPRAGGGWKTRFHGSVTRMVIVIDITIFFLIIVIVTIIIIIIIGMFAFHTVVNCAALAFFVFSRLQLLPPTATRFYFQIKKILMVII